VEKLHNEELRGFYSALSLIRIIRSRSVRWAEHVARIGEKKNAFRLLLENQKRKRPLGRARHRWIDNIKMNLIEIEWLVWTGLFWLMIGTGGELL
jgi:hypothetical protein